MTKSNLNQAKFIINHYTLNLNRMRW